MDYRPEERSHHIFITIIYLMYIYILLLFSTYVIGGYVYYLIYNDDS